MADALFLAVPDLCLGRKGGGEGYSRKHIKMLKIEYFILESM